MNARPLPDLLAGFDAERLAKEGSTLVALDRDLRIVWTNAAWRRFALENRGDAVLERFGPGTKYTSGISPPMRGFFDAAFTNAMITGERFELDYECSSAKKYALNHMLALPIDGKGLLLVHSRLVEEPQVREPSEPVLATYRLPTGFVVQCANCRRVRRADGTAWDWIPAWVELPPVAVSHGICPTCLGYYWGSQKASRRRA